MNYLKWEDFDPQNYDELYKEFKSSFVKLLPNNSKASFVYHCKRYKTLICTEFELKQTFVEELERFESYLIETYNLKQLEDGN